MSKSNLHWRSYVQPGRIFGNLYFVGTYAASSHIIDTGEGLIMIDTGYAEGAYLILHNIWDLGFCPYDIKYIIHSHGHYDHVGATCAIAKLTGAKTAISRIDAPMVDGTLVGEGTDIAREASICHWRASWSTNSRISSLRIFSWMMVMC
jgi:glyoxylase-like metal-dependent hydrolase (beta-lactamase superfamily II)